MGCFSSAGVSPVVPLLSMWPGKKIVEATQKIVADADDRAGAHVLALEEALDRNALLLASALLALAAALLVHAVTR